MMILPVHLKFRFCSMQFKEKSSEQNLLHSDMREFFVGLSKISIKSKLSLYCTTGKWWLYIFLNCENQVPCLNNIMPSFRLNLLSFSLLLCKRRGLLFSYSHIFCSNNSIRPGGQSSLQFGFSGPSNTKFPFLV